MSIDLILIHSVNVNNLHLLSNYIILIKVSIAWAFKVLLYCIASILLLEPFNTSKGWLLPLLLLVLLDIRETARRVKNQYSCID